MNDLALDPSETRPVRASVEAPARPGLLRVGLIGLATATGLCAFGVAASSVMAGLAAPPRPALAPPSRAAAWPELKDGVPALAGAPAQAAQAAPVMRPEPNTPALRMAALPEAVGPQIFPATVPAKASTTPLATLPAAPAVSAAVVPPTPAPSAAVPPQASPEKPAQRVLTPVPVAVIGPARQAVALAPARTAALQPPRPAETVRARTLAEPAAAPSKPIATPAAVAAPAPSAPAAGAAEKPPRKVAAAHKPVPARGPSAASAPSQTTVAAAEPEPEETEVLGIKLPSLAPAGRKLKESVDALGEAVRNVF